MKIESFQIEALNQGDESAWKDFFILCDPLLKKIVGWKKWNFDPIVQEDVCQHIRSLLPKAIARYTGSSNMETYITRICINKCVDEIQRQVKRRERYVDIESAATDEKEPLHIERLPADSDHFNPVQQIMRIERGAKLRECLQQLDDDCHQTILGIYLKGFSYKQIAQNMGISINTVGPRLTRCMEKLRTLITQNRLFEDEL